MSETIRINGVDVPIDSIAGATNEETTEAYRRRREQRLQEADGGYYSCPLHSGTKFVGTPRLQKHRGGRVGGVRIK